MLSLAARVRVFVARERVDFREGMDGLYAILRDAFSDDPLSEHLYLFFNAPRDRLKILMWDRNGFWLCAKRLDRGTFERIDGSSARFEIDRARLAMLLDGIDTKNSRMHERFVRDVRIASRDGHELARTAP